MLRRWSIIAGFLADTEKISVLNGGIEDAKEITVLVTGSLSRRGCGLSLGLLGSLRSLSVVELLDGYLGRSVVCIKIPHLGGVVGRASGKVLHIRRQEDACQIVFVSLESANRDDASGLLILDHAPDVDISLQQSEWLVMGIQEVSETILSCFQHTAETRHLQRSH